MRDKLKEIDSLCDAIINETYDQPDDSTAGEIKAIVADLLSVSWDHTLQALELWSYRKALEKISSLGPVYSHTWKIAYFALAEADRVRDGQPMTEAALIAERDALRAERDRLASLVEKLSGEHRCPVCDCSEPS